MIDQQSFLEGPQRGEFEIPDGATVERCKSCGTLITWVTTAKGNAMPVDLARLRVSGSTSYGRSHFATCPDAVAWRRANRQTVGNFFDTLYS